MNDAYDCEYDMVDDPMGMLQEAHARIRELEAEHSKEIDRLRLTDAEREAVGEAMDGYIAWMDDNVCRDKPEVQAVLYRLRGLLERLK